MKSKNTKSKKPKNTRSTKLLEGLSKSEEVAHYSAVLVEDLLSNFKMVIEKVDSLEENLTKKMDERFNKQNVRLETIEIVVKSHSTILNNHSKILDQHSKILDQHSKILDQHSNSLNKIESKFDALAQKVAAHDEDIKELQTIVSQ